MQIVIPERMPRKRRASGDIMSARQRADCRRYGTGYDHRNVRIISKQIFGFVLRRDFSLLRALAERSHTGRPMRVFPDAHVVGKNDINPLRLRAQILRSKKGISL